MNTELEEAYIDWNEAQKRFPNGPYGDKAGFNFPKFKIVLELIRSLNLDRDKALSELENKYP